MQNKTGSGVKFADWAVVILAILLYFKTAEVLSYFSPKNINEIIGMNVGWLYGYVTAFFVEGVAVAYHFYPGARVHTPAIIVKWILIILSGICQVFDGKIVTETIASMPEQQRLFFEYGLPLLPWFVLILLIAVGEIPNDPHVRSKYWRGVKHLLPDVKRIWEGDPELQKENSEFSPKVAEQLKKNSDPVKPNPNGQDKETVNPTKRQA